MKYEFLLVPNVIVENTRDIVFDDLEDKYFSEVHLNFFEDVLENRYTPLFEFGRASMDVVDSIIAVSELYFKNNMMNDYFKDMDIHVVNESGVLKAIEFYARKIEDYFLNLIEDDTEELSFGEAHPKLENLRLFIERVLKRFGYSFNIRCFKTTSHSEKCVQAVRNKLNWISPRYRSQSLAEKMGDENLERVQAISHERSSMIDWNKNNKFSMTDTWLYEYEIFTLVNIWKNVDFDKYSVIFVGR